MSDEKKGESEHINLKALGQDNAIVQFKIKKHTPLRKLMNAYCDRAGLSMQVVRFRFDGQPINENDTPTSLEMEEGDTIEVYQQQTGGASNTAQYAHYVFNTLDQDRSGLLSFEEFVTGLSILSRGTLEEKLRWTFSLYDINGDGYITKEEMTEIVTAIYDLMGKIVEPMIDDDAVREKVERLFQKMDLNRDGVLTLDEFLDCCLRDEDIIRSMGVFDSNF
ncbi:Kv channel-interacting protein 4 [Papilio xuthus]|uniref:Kv channel-interacting protein 4 n=1 Tax=Papilio xuthus TaxID=66420 RepID=A0A194PM55_PAPXU|nr:Kv channel-interacting protein 4 [Papilio xuthus]